MNAILRLLIDVSGAARAEASLLALAIVSTIIAIVLAVPIMWPLP